MAKERHLTSLERAVAQAVGNGRDLGRSDDPARVSWPQLWEWLSKVSVGEQIKSPAYLSVRLGPEGVLVSLVDRDLSLSIDACASGLTECFAAMEAALSSNAPPIKSWGKREPRLRKRRG